MTVVERNVKYLALCGIEWELVENRKPETERNAAPNFSIPKTKEPIPTKKILDIAKSRAASINIIEAIKCFSEHPLFNSAKNTVLPSLCKISPKLLVISDIPSISDDSTGQILSGAEGELFDKMMQAVGLSRSDIAITPLVFWRPAGGRTPTQDEILMCKPFIERIINDLKPQKILTLGNIASREIAGATLPKDLGKIFGNVIPIFKLDLMIQKPSIKKDVWEALKLL